MSAEREEGDDAGTRAAGEARYRTLFDYAPDGILIADRDSYYLDAIPSICRMLGYSRSELIGLHASDILALAEVPQIAPALEIIRAKAEYHREFQFRRKDGSTFFAEVMVTTMPDGNLLAMIRDVAERREAEHRLRESEERFRSAFEDAAVGLALTTPDSRVLQVNRAACNLFDRSEAELMQSGSLALTHPEDVLISRRAMDRMLAGEDHAVHFEKRFLRKSGAPVWVHISARLVRNLAGEPQYFVSLIQDITARRLAEEEVRRLNADLEDRVRQRTAQLETALAELQAFSYSVSHDLRSPLRAVSGFADILRREHGSQLDAEGLRLLAVVVTNIQRMGVLIDDLLALSQLGRRRLHVSTTDMRALVESAWDELVAAQPLPPAELVLGELPTVQGDASLLRHVWSNLLGNALKFSSRSPVRRVAVDARQGADGTEFCIADNGIGFDMRYIDRAFGVFERLHPDDEFEGTGVGLAIVARIVARHGGKTWAESTLGSGARFYFSLPPTPREPT